LGNYRILRLLCRFDRRLHSLVQTIVNTTNTFDNAIKPCHVQGMETLRKRWNNLPLWGKFVAVLIVLNEVRGVLVAGWAIDKGALNGSMPASELAILTAVVLIPALLAKAYKRKA
jgi:hypothetical protein